MKALFITLCLLLLSPISVSWGQDEPAPKNKETSEPNTEETDGQEKPEDDQQQSVNKPIRLPSGTPRSFTPANESKSMELLASQLPKDASLWLQADTGRFLSLWQKDRSGTPKGALLMVHAEGEHAIWPISTKPLHDTLPNYGWSTLAISLPSPEFTQVPERTFPVKTIPVKTEENADTDALDQETVADTETSQQEAPKEPNPITAKKPSKIENKKRENLPSMEEVTERRLEAALRFLHDRGQFNVILLGNGGGAIRAHRFLEKITPKITNPKLKATFEKPVRAIVIVNGRNQLSGNQKAQTYDKWFNYADVPVLDIFVDSDHQNSLAAKQRKILAQQKNVKTYRQVRIAHLNQETNWGENQLSRRIRSFLDNNAAGFEIEKATLRRYK
jgi:hypothetical protein